MTMSPAEARSVVASLNYLTADSPPARTYAYDPPDGSPRFNGRLESRAMAIADARRLDTAPSLDAQGFRLVAHASAVRDFSSDAELESVHFAEIEALLMSLFPTARRAKVFDRTRRARAAGRPPLDGVGGSFAGTMREPVGRVHADYTARSGWTRVRQVLGDEAGDDPARFRIVGLWRPLNDEPIDDAPLAVADARSVAAHDLRPNELIYAERRGETVVVTHDPGHRWHYFPRMSRDEVVVFNHWIGGADPSINQVVPHTAFEDPSTPVDATPRRSLELRAIVEFSP